MIALLFTFFALDPQVQKFMAAHPVDFLNYKMEMKCQSGCSKNYEQGHWLPKEKMCFCGDLIPPEDLFLKDFTLQWKPSPPVNNPDTYGY